MTSQNVSYQRMPQPPRIYRGVCGKGLAQTGVLFPSALSSTDKASSITIRNHLEARYTASSAVEEPGSVRANYPVDPSIDFYYFEMTMLNAGRKGFVSIGLEPGDIDLSSLPGWQERSYGYHGDDGRYLNGTRLFATGSVHDLPHGERFTTGDTVGLAWDLVESVIYFTKNGIALGEAFLSISRNMHLYPVIGLNSPGERVVVNFGEKDFVYPLELARFRDAHG